MKLAKSRLHTQRRHLEHKLAQLRPLAAIPPPPSGWVRAIRESLGMTARQLGRALGMSGVAATKLELRERERSITLRDLDRAAALLHCRVVYALAPIEGLEATLRAQAERAAARLSAKADHAMKLEAQQVDRRELGAQGAVLAKLLAETLDTRLWDPPEGGEEGR